MVVIIVVFLAAGEMAALAVDRVTLSDGEYGSAATWSGNIIPGDGNNDGPTITVNPGPRNVTFSMAADYVSSGRMLVGITGGYSGQLVFTNSAGTLTLGGDSFGACNYIGVDGGVGYVNLAAGKLSLTNAPGAVGAGWLRIGCNGANANGTLQINGGTLEVGTSIAVGQMNAANRGVVTLNSGVVLIGTMPGSDANKGALLLGDGSGGAATVNLNGGMLSLNTIQFGAAGLPAINFNGGTLQVRTNNARIPVGGTLNVGNGGAVFDTAGNTLTVVPALTNSGTGGLIKTGAGTLNLRGGGSYTGATLISNGVLYVESPMSPVAGSAVWLDAADLSTIVTNGTNVITWLDKSGSGRHVGQPSAGLQPGYLPGLQGGKGGVSFAGGQVLTNSVPNLDSTGLTIFAVVNSLATDNNSRSPVAIRNTSTRLSVHVLGQTPKVQTWNGAAVFDGVRTTVGTGTICEVSVLDTGSQQSLYKNGQLADGPSAYVLGAAGQPLDIGSSTPAPSGESFVGIIYEVLIYTNALADRDRQSVEDYLDYKWLGMGVTNNALSTNTAVTVSSGAVLDLNGGGQTVAGLGGDGMVTGGMVTVSGTLFPGGSNNVGALAVVGTLAMAAGATYDWEYGSATGDLVVVDGDLVLPATGSIHVGGATGSRPAKAALFSYTGTCPRTDFSGWTVWGRAGGRVENNTLQHTVYLVMSAGTVIVVR